MIKIDAVPCGLLLTDADDVVTRVNATFLEWTGHQHADVVGTAFHDLLDAGSQAYYGTWFGDQVRAQSELRAISLRLTRADGTSMPILVNATVGVADDGTEEVRLAVFDGTSREEFEREMLNAKREAEASASSVRILQEAATRFLAARTEDQVAMVLAEVTRAGLAASDAAVVAYEPDGSSYRMLNGEHLRDLLRAVRASRPEGPRALRPDEMVVIPDLEEAFSRSDELGELLRAQRAAAFSAIAITDGDELLGAVACLYGRPREFGENEVELHRALAKQAGLAFSHVWLQGRMRELASVDQLTQVATRVAIDEIAENAFAAAKDTDSHLSLIFLDLDGFKAINDRFGHRMGDRVLAVSAKRIRDSVRAEDRIGRFGGDEFLIVCEHTDGAGALIIAERIASAVRESIEGLPAGFHVTASIGIATHRPGETRYTSAEAMTGGADFAMYASKRNGRDQIALDTAAEPAPAS
ncbi:sensor domain-containing diguanylate cyclase [Agromyces aerolatus]|uniref:sensor domain-containing diguanylate cyclase n=1 Tax=Agromyces sp. LY-1074 TaxID=3074080 RepID=UPI00285DCE23|nr:MULTISPECIES: diguanylate cyclase [unclassified Agromyces]MDR5698580.1 diguanylate cyclase [Agromyces sp. LY-1074]MDR5704874.1 diguanylate cyclase [Agromyces sp. LY-1358]